MISKGALAALAKAIGRSYMATHAIGGAAGGGLGAGAIAALNGRDPEEIMRVAGVGALTGAGMGAGVGRLSSLMPLAGFGERRIMFDLLGSGATTVVPGLYAGALYGDASGDMELDGRPTDAGFMPLETWRRREPR